MPRATPAAIAALAVAGIAALLVGLVMGGSTTEPLLVDPGPFVRWGLPIAGVATNLAAAATLGPLVLLCVAFPPGRGDTERVAALAAGGAALWTVATLVTGLLSYAEIIGSGVRFDEAFGAGLWQFLTATDVGAAWAWSALLVAAAAVIVAFARNLWPLALATILGAAALVPVSSLSHAAGTADHTVAWGALFLHMLFAAVWLGGVLALVVARPGLEGDRQRAIAERFSSIAIVGFIVVAGSGLVSAILRIGTFDNLWTPYGAIVVVKGVAIVGLGVLGAMNRRWAIRRLPSSGAFWWLVGAELLLMGIASGMATALGVTPPPIRAVPTGTSPAEILTGAPLPPLPTLEQYLFGWAPDPIWLAISIALAVFYVGGVLRLRRRGDHWPWLRTASWLVGVVVLAWVTSGGINAYADVLFSGHMLGHMVLGMVVPLFLVPGAPITLALRTIRRRDDGSRGPREWILALVHSPVFRVIANPYVASALFVGSLWVFYYTPLLRWAVTTHLGHEWMVVHFLVTGYLFVQALIGIDPAPDRPPYPVRLLLLLATMALHAFFGLAILSGTGLLLADWFGAMGWEGGVSAIEDQQRAGGIAWSVGEIPTLALAIAVAVLWARNDDREQRRLDRQADRDQDAELAAYNRMLEERARRD